MQEPNKYLSLKGQSALVTGANSGIGKAIAKSLAAAGAQVVVNYVTKEEDADRVVSEISEKGGKAMAVGADVTKEEEVLIMFAEMLREYGTIDILVNNAGIQRKSSFQETTLRDWNEVLATNLTGYFLCAREAVKEFLRRGVDRERSVAAGKIICISSVHDVIPWAGFCSYTASKGGVMMLMKTIAQELAPHKIRVNSISPGAIRTEINRSEWERSEEASRMLELIPYKRIGNPQDIAKVAVWLASDESDYLTGATIYADGGMTLYPAFSEGG